MRGMFDIAHDRGSLTATYLRAVQSVDRQIGAVLDTLDADTALALLGLPVLTDVAGTPLAVQQR